MAHPSLGNKRTRRDTLLVNTTRWVWDDLEAYILDSAPEDLRLCVLTGPVLADDDPDYRGIRLPRSFWKVVAGKAPAVRAAAFHLTREEYLGDLEFKPHRLGAVQVTLAELGELAGIDFGHLLQAGVLAGEEAVVRRIPLRSVEDVRI